VVWPTRPPAGVITRVRLAPEPLKEKPLSSTRAGFDDVAVSTTLATGSSTSLSEIEIGPVGALRKVDWLGIAAMAGGSFTITVKLRVVMNSPSSAVTVTVDWPEAIEEEVMLILASDPPGVILATPASPLG